MSTQQKKLLYLVHRIPYPPNKGDKIRSFNILKFLAQHYQIYLGTFVDDVDDWKYLSELEGYCEEIYAIPLKSFISKLRSLSALFGSDPMTVPYYKDKKLADWVETQKNRHDFDAVLIFSSAMAQYVTGSDWNDQHRVIDFVDVDSDKWQQYAQKKPWPMSWIYRREAETLCEYDKQIADKFAASLFVSEKEAALFASFPGVDATKVSHADNGVDIEYFHPENKYINPYNEDERVIVFTGAMDYWANADAVHWFATQVFPEVKKIHDNARFYIVGSHPSRQVTELSALPGVTVTGAVQEIRPYIAHAKLAVAPMRIARGVQNKVLEAMAMARAVVVTPQGFDGIVGEAGKEVVVAETAQDFAKAVCQFLNNPNSANDVGMLARKHIEQRYTWGNCLQTLLPMMERQHESA